MALVLARKEAEEIVIGDDIVITVLQICGERVRLAIKAPDNVSIRRSELPPLPDEEGTSDDIV